ncbi:Uncharacterized protein Rs2_04604 [Raphanus sativus]|nr:Uncharacterized protein Rs2_04604 [Raphanus sativus]
MISHEERTCPELSEEQKERNRLDRIAQREKEERATRETFSLTDRQAPGRERSPVSKTVPARSFRREVPYDTRRTDYSGSVSRRNDLREKITERRETQSKNVWNRLDRNNDVYYPRDRERFHPYQRERTQVYKEDNITHGRLQTKQQHLTWKPVEGNSQNKSVTVEPQSGRSYSPR